MITDHSRTRGQSYVSARTLRILLFLLHHLAGVDGPDGFDRLAEFMGYPCDDTRQALAELRQMEANDLVVVIEGEHPSVYINTGGWLHIIRSAHWAHYGSLVHQARTELAGALRNSRTHQLNGTREHIYQQLMADPDVHTVRNAGQCRGLLALFLAEGWVKLLVGDQTRRVLRLIQEPFAGYLFKHAGQRFHGYQQWKLGDVIMMPMPEPPGPPPERKTVTPPAPQIRPAWRPVPTPPRPPVPQRYWSLPADPADRPNPVPAHNGTSHNGTSLPASVPAAAPPPPAASVPPAESVPPEDPPVARRTRAVSRNEPVRQIDINNPASLAVVADIVLVMAEGPADWAPNDPVNVAAKFTPAIAAACLAFYAEFPGGHAVNPDLNTLGGRLDYSYASVAIFNRLMLNQKLIYRVKEDGQNHYYLLKKGWLQLVLWLAEKHREPVPANVIRIAVLDPAPAAVADLVPDQAAPADEAPVPEPAEPVHPLAALLARVRDMELVPDPDGWTPQGPREPHPALTVRQAFAMGLFAIEYGDAQGCTEITPDDELSGLLGVEDAKARINVLMQTEGWGIIGKIFDQQGKGKAKVEGYRIRIRQPGRQLLIMLLGLEIDGNLPEQLLSMPVSEVFQKGDEGTLILIWAPDDSMSEVLD